MAVVQLGKRIKRMYAYIYDISLRIAKSSSWMAIYRSNRYNLYLIPLEIWEISLGKLWNSPGKSMTIVALTTARLILAISGYTHYNPTTSLSHELDLQPESSKRGISSRHMARQYTPKLYQPGNHDQPTCYKPWGVSCFPLTHSCKCMHHRDVWPLSQKRKADPSSCNIHCATRMVFWVAPPATYSTWQSDSRPPFFAGKALLLWVAK